MGDGAARARRCYLKRAWTEACDGFLADLAALDPDDLERLAVCAYLVGRNSESDDAWTKAHHRRLDAGDLPGAVRCAFWLGFRLVNAYALPDANGWIARLERLLAGVPEDSLPSAQLAYLTGLLAAFEGDLERSSTDLSTSADLASRCRDEELAALARLALGRVRIFQGEIKAGVQLLDDAMLVVRSGAISPIAVGDSYCTAIDACHDLFDIRRGQAWTDGLTQWCDQQPDLVPFAGVCQVHRSEYLQLRGAWVEAMAQVGRARAQLAKPRRQPAYGAAVYQMGELHRLRGEFDRADVCYREASASGRDPHPGLALLRLRQGRHEDAVRAIDRALAEAEDPVGRPPLLSARVEILLACGRLCDAKASTSELTGLASSLRSPMLDAVSARAQGAMRLEEDDARGALVYLRRASEGFRELDAPYEVACTAVLLAAARRTVGDAEGAGLEIDAARTTFERLGARPDLARLPGEASPGLTARELQVLRQVARGETNRSIGAALGLSERTVDRHVSNIFAKLGVSSRAAATAHAYEAELL